MRLDLHSFRAVILLAAFGFFAQLTTAAHAMNIYNFTPVKIDESFVCGLACVNNWDNVDPQTVKSRPNEGGTVTAYPSGFKTLDDCPVSFNVDPHGWVEVTAPDNRTLTLTSYHSDGSIRQTCNVTNISPAMNF